MFYMSIPRPDLRGVFSFLFRRICLVVCSTYVYVHKCLEEECSILNQSGSCTLRPPRLRCCFRCIDDKHRRTQHLTSFVDRHKNIKFYRTSMVTEQVGVQFSQFMYIVGGIRLLWWFLDQTTCLSLLNYW